MTELEAQAKDYAMSRKLNLSEPTDITHVIELIEKAYIAGSKGQWHDLRKNPADLPELHIMIITMAYGMTLILIMNLEVKSLPGVIFRVLRKQRKNREIKGKFPLFYFDYGSRKI